MGRKSRERIEYGWQGRRELYGLPTQGSEQLQAVSLARQLREAYGAGIIKRDATPLEIQKCLGR